MLSYVGECNRARAMATWEVTNFDGLFAATVAMAEEPGTILLDSGTYFVTKPLIIPPNTILRPVSSTMSRSGDLPTGIFGLFPMLHAVPELEGDIVTLSDGSRIGMASYFTTPVLGVEDDTRLRQRHHDCFEQAPGTSSSVLIDSCMLILDSPSDGSLPRADRTWDRRDLEQP